jgi:hypothetical protein
MRRPWFAVHIEGAADEGEAAWLPRIPVRDDINLFDIAELGKSREQFLLRGLEAEIATKILLMVSL